jgi:peptidoglycan hydrolase-like protein with peptidoglycan-binding domain
LQVTFTDQQTAIIAAARAEIGKPYQYDGKGPNTFDCSGLTAWAFQHGAGIDIGAGTAGQLLNGILVAENVSFPSIVAKLQPCDVSFPIATHCQLWTGTDIIEAAEPGTVVREVAEWAVPPYQATVYQVRRYLPTSGPSAPVSAPRWPGRYLRLTSPYMAGQDVREWQAQVNVLDGITALVVDGLFGPDTENATKAVQAHLRVAVDGIVGPVSWQAAFG